jgi:hypothetical protein
MNTRRKLTVNVTKKLLARLDREVTQLKPFVTRHRVAAAALDLGLELLTGNPGLLAQYYRDLKEDEP